MPRGKEKKNKEKNLNVKIKAPDLKKKPNKQNDFLLQNGSQVFFVPQIEVPMGLWITQNWF